MPGLCRSGHHYWSIKRRFSFFHWNDRQMGRSIKTPEVDFRRFSATGPMDSRVLSKADGLGCRLVGEQFRLMIRSHRR